MLIDVSGLPHRAGSFPAEPGCRTSP